MREQLLHQASVAAL